MVLGISLFTYGLLAAPRPATLPTIRNVTSVPNYIDQIVDVSEYTIWYTGVTQRHRELMPWWEDIATANMGNLNRMRYLYIIEIDGYFVPFRGTRDDYADGNHVHGEVMHLEEDHIMRSLLANYDGFDEIADRLLPFAIRENFSQSGTTDEQLAEVVGLGVGLTAIATVMLFIYVAVRTKRTRHIPPTTPTNLPNP